MDPLHPLPRIEPAAPAPPERTRVQRVEREQDHESPPDRERPPQRDSQDADQFEDDYDPDWNDWKTIDPSAAVEDLDPDPQPGWDSSAHPDRRAAPDRRDGPDCEPPGPPHIDIIA